MSSPRREDEEEAAALVAEALEHWTQITIQDVLAFAPKGALPAESLRQLAIDTYIARASRRIADAWTKR